MKLLKIIFCACFLHGILFTGTVSGQTDEIEISSNVGQQFGIGDIDIVEVADNLNFINSLQIEGEDISSATVGRVLPRSLASKQSVWGQFGCQPIWPFFALPGYVRYSNLNLGTGTLYFRIRYSKNSTATVPLTIKINGEVIGTLMLTNLHNWNQFAWSNALQFSITPPFNPNCSAPESVKVEQLSATSVSVSWEGVSSAFNYLVRYSATDIESCSAVSVTQDTSIVLSNLTADVDYQFQVASTCCDEGWSEFGAITSLDAPTDTSIPLFKANRNPNTDLREEPARLSIHPNPARGEVSFTLPNKSADAFTIRIYDQLGRTVKEVLQTNSSELFIGELPKGSYFLEVSQKGQIWVEKLVKY